MMTSAGQSHLRRCDHSNKEMTRRPDKNGNDRFQIQCKKCGASVGGFVRKSEVAKRGPLDSVPLFDEGMREKVWQQTQALDEKKVDFELQSFKPSYDDYLQSSEWRIKRQLVLKRAKSICEGCGQNAATQVHHFSYDNLGAELLWQLAAVCDACHDRCHPWKFDTDTRNEARRKRLHYDLEKSPLFQEWLKADKTAPTEPKTTTPSSFRTP